MMAIAIRESLSEQERNKIDLQATEFTEKKIEIGPLLFKIIIGEPYVDTQATMMAICQKLCDLDKYLLKVGGNVTQMNLHVKLLLNQLAVGQEHTTDLIANLFKAYSTSLDPASRKYFKKKKDNYEDGDTYTTNQIIKLAGKKY